ncbi:SAC3/GANP/Nin1/mts3/eIF-3 p25 family [Euphorbia peplus]|nr:SAC3/GANP/Nin1/mts3/eIF-3 p25 family [Euphorbia peplus]
MMNQGVNTHTISHLDPNSLEGRYAVDASQPHTSSYLPSTTASEASTWTMHRVDNHSTENGIPSNATYYHEQQTEGSTRSAPEALNATSVSSTTTSVAASAPQDYNSYVSYPHATDPYGYASSGYAGYYSGYQQQPNQPYSQQQPNQSYSQQQPNQSYSQQQPNQSYSQQQPNQSYSQQQPNQAYSQPVGAYQNTGAPYQPISSFQNTASYAGTPSYTSTYYNTGDYQTAGAYPSTGYSNQTSSWNDGNYAQYTTPQYSNYNMDTTSSHSSGTAPVASVNYEQQWADYYNQTEVTCAPGTEQLSVTSAPNQGTSVPGVTAAYTNSNGQPPSFTPSWRPDSSSSEFSMQGGAAASGTQDSYWKQASLNYQNHHATPIQSQVPSNYQNHHATPIQSQVPSNYQNHHATPIQSQVPSNYQNHHAVPTQSHASSNYQNHHAATTQSQASSNYQNHHATPIQSQAPSNYQNHHAIPMQPQFQNPLDSKISYDHFQEQQKPIPQGPNSQYPAGHQVPQNYQIPVQTVPSLDTRRANKLQIPTNPRIASNLNLGLSKTDKDVTGTNVVAKPAYIAVSMPKPNDQASSNDAADSILKPGMFPGSLRFYVERALKRCQDHCENDPQMAACQAVMKEIITKATADGTLHTRDWDIEPLFPLPNPDFADKEISQSSSSVASLPKYKRSPSRRTKSRWEPLAEEKPVQKPVPVSNDSPNYGRWNRKPLIGNSESKVDPLNNKRFSFSELKTSSKSAQKPFKRQRLVDAFNSANNGDESSGSDKEQSLTAYYSGAIALADTPEEKKKRENRSKRFEKRQGHLSEIKYFKPKNVGAGNLYSKRASALMLSKNFDDEGSRAVEDIDWDALTVKGTCQEIEKRYLRLTSAPDPSTVRPEEVLEKALVMVQNSQKNYLYKCDQLKSIRQDLTVQRIVNQLTVKVYETHARLAMEVGDLAEFNQCQSQLKTLYAEGIQGNSMEFAAYNLLCVILHSNNTRDLVSSMSRLTEEAKKDKAVKHALAVRAAVASGNYVMFFRLYKTAPNLNACLMNLCVEKTRYKAVTCMSRSYRPTIPVPYVAQVLGFSGVGENDEKNSSGSEECMEWLKAHGACLVGDNTGEMQLDTKASSSTLFIPVTDDAVSHGDATLAVNDFLARASL